MTKRKENKKNKSQLKLVGSLLIIVGICLLYGKPIYDYFVYREESIKIEEFYEEQKQEEVFIQQENHTEEIKKEKTDNEKYIAVIKIPKIKLEKGLCDISSTCNSVSRNIEILKESSYPNIENGNFILAGHSGNGNISYFRDVDKLSIDDEISIFYGKKEYQYKVMNIYEIEKTGKANIVRNGNKTTLTLITCKGNEDKQLVVISELIRVI